MSCLAACIQTFRSDFQTAGKPDIETGDRDGLAQHRQTAG